MHCEMQVAGSTSEMKLDLDLDFSHLGKNPVCTLQQLYYNLLMAYIGTKAYYFLDQAIYTNQKSYLCVNYLQFLINQLN